MNGTHSMKKDLILHNILKRTIYYLPIGLCLLFSGTACKQVAPGMQISEFCIGGERYVSSTRCQGFIKTVEITPCVVEELELDEFFATNPELEGEFTNSDTPEDYLVGPSDTLSVIVWGHPELNNPTNASATLDQLGFTVNQKGTINFPYIGDVHVSGKNVDEIRELLSERLKALIVKPAISVKVLTYNSQYVNVVGEVNLPANVPVDDTPMTPLDAIGRAGGATFAGDLRHVVVKRGCSIYVLDTLPKMCDCNPKPLILKHRDVVYVPNKLNNQVYVLGEFVIPQSIVMDADCLTLSDAIARSSGVDGFASNPSQLFVFRENKYGEKFAYHLDATSPAALILANRFPLQRQDIIYVGTYKPAILDRIMTNFLSTTRVITDLSWSASNINEVVNKYNQSYNSRNQSAANNDINNNGD